LNSEKALAENEANKILSLDYNKDGNIFNLKIQCISTFVSTVYELPNPQRVIVDIADAKIDTSFKKPDNFPFRYSYSEVTGSNPSITRFEFFVDKLESYNSTNESKQLNIKVATNGLEDTSPAPTKTDLSEQLRLKAIKIERKQSDTIIYINTNKKIDKYTATPSTIESKPQLIIFIDNIDILSAENNIKIDNSSVKKIELTHKGSGAQISFFSTNGKIISHSITETNSGLIVTIPEKIDHESPSNIISSHNNISNQLPEINPLDPKLSSKAREQQMQDAFNFSGYNNDRITVEFQKMDLHNVFNFLRQVSGVNIVVDESVEGSLTLVLDDVPWDFALDIILNLKGLEKEERFNTIVIYPKGKGFSWPEQAEKNLSFQADSTVIEKEALVVQQQDKQSPEIMEAKEIIARAIVAERAENFETAASLYERAFEKWPKNINLANKISAIYLTPLRQNAKALFFAQRSLATDANNQDALLQAGIASANMLNNQLAEQYFSQAVRGKKPTKEALLNYSSFKEERKEYRESLSLLNQHDQLFGKSLDSMIAAARINDKTGATDLANRQYREILNAGFQVPPDLSKYIQTRVGN